MENTSFGILLLLLLLLCLSSNNDNFRVSVNLHNFYMIFYLIRFFGKSLCLSLGSAIYEIRVNFRRSQWASRLLDTRRTTGEEHILRGQNWYSDARLPFLITKNYVEIVFDENGVACAELNKILDS